MLGAGTHELYRDLLYPGGIPNIVPGAETDVSVRVAGRLLLIRRQGKLSFGRLRDGTGEVQLFVSQQVVGPDGHDAFDDLDLGDIVFEFESSALHFEKIVPPGSEAVVHVRPQQPGRYNFFDDFHHETQGFLVVP